MKKSTIIGISKSEKINQYIFKKESNLAENITKLLKGLKIKDNYWFIDNINQDKLVNFSKITDKRYNIKDGEYDIDLFIGAKEVFLVIRTKSDKQQKISEEIFKIAKFGRMKK